MTALALPTRREEDWRYSDVAAVASVWPVPAPERIVLGADEVRAHALLQDADESAVIVRDYVIEVAAGARLDFHLLNSNWDLSFFDIGRCELKAASIFSAQVTRCLRC